MDKLTYLFIFLEFFPSNLRKMPNSQIKKTYELILMKASEFIEFVNLILFKNVFTSLKTNNMAKNMLQKLKVSSISTDFALFISF